MVKSVNTNKVEMDKKAAIAVVFENPEFGKIRTLTDENGVTENRKLKFARYLFDKISAEFCF